MLSSISGYHFAGHWPIGNPPYVSNAYIDYDMNSGSYTPDATQLTSVGTANIPGVFGDPTRMSYVSGPPSYLFATAFVPQFTTSTLPQSDSLIPGSSLTISGWHRGLAPNETGALFFYESLQSGRFTVSRSGQSLSMGIGFGSGATATATSGGVFDSNVWNLLTYSVTATSTTVLITFTSNGNGPSNLLFNNSFGTVLSDTSRFIVNANTTFRPQWSRIQVYKDTTTIDHAAVWAAERALYGR